MKTISLLTVVGLTAVMFATGCMTSEHHTSSAYLTTDKDGHVIVNEYHHSHDFTTDPNEILRHIMGADSAPAGNYPPQTQYQQSQQPVQIINNFNQQPQAPVQQSARPSASDPICGDTNLGPDGPLNAAPQQTYCAPPIPQTTTQVWPQAYAAAPQCQQYIQVVPTAPTYTWGFNPLARIMFVFGGGGHYGGRGVVYTSNYRSYGGGYATYYRPGAIATLGWGGGYRGGGYRRY